MTYSSPFTPLNDDSYAPAIPKLDHQQWENYGIYTLACIATEQTDVDTRYNYEKIDNKYTVVNGKLVELNPFLTYPPTQHQPLLAKFFAYQTCNVEPIPVDFNHYIETYHSLGNAEIKTYQYVEITEIP